MASRDPLADYNAKRDFARTSEPKGEVAAPAAGARAILCVQKHDATRLHWDLRLEVDGVLKSWAVTRGPSLDPEDKRLAVRTEDHPMAYASFEGTIPAKDYGGGTVMLWDHGWWEPIAGKSADTLADGHLHFIAHGERMQGEWILIRLRPKPGEKRENWLLRKVEDAHARTGDVLVERALTSVATGRTMEQIATGADVPRARKARPAKRLPAPTFRPPMLAVAAAEPPGAGWLHEIKYDGYRCLIGFGADGVRAWTRSGLDWSDKFSGICQAVAQLPGAGLIDGEVVALDDTGKPSFSALQAALKHRRDNLLLFAFDLIEHDGEELAILPLIERKARLSSLLAAAGPPLHFSDHIDSDGTLLLHTMAQLGYEGIVSKRASAPYEAGQRNGDWLKVKVDRREEFVVVGWLPSDKRGRPFSSLLVGQHDNGVLVYKGRVGTGFDDATASDLAARFARTARPEPAVSNPENVANDRDPHPDPQWIEPELVVEVRFAEYTAEGVLRHARFVALREDKPASEVSPEVIGERMPVMALTPSSLPISSPDRQMFGSSGITKGDLAAWYETIAPRALAFAGGRPLSLFRCPDGIEGQCFFQKHLTKGFGTEVSSVEIVEGDGVAQPTFVVVDKPGLLRCVQMGTVEFHGWGALAGDVERPDRMVFDLDPDEGLDFVSVRTAAKDLHDRLADLGLASFPMLSGGKGVHVIVPLSPRAGWPVVEAFARKFALALEAGAPDRYTSSMSKARRKGRIFVDWLRNQRGSTAVLPWSVRARAGAPVAVPVSWDFLREAKAANIFSLRDAPALLAHATQVAPEWGIADQALNPD